MTQSLPQALDSIVAGEPLRARVSSPADLVATVPYLLGFRPSESLVIVSLRGERRRIGLTMRADLAPLLEGTQSLTTMLDPLRRDGGEAFLAVVFTDRGDAEDLPAADLVDEIEEWGDHEDVRLLEAVLVDGDRWWSYVCSDERCCPSEGVPIDGSATSSVAAAMVVSGTVVEESRDMLVGELAPLGGLVAKAVELEIDRALEAWVARVAAGGVGAERAEAEDRGCIEDAVAARVRDPQSRLTVPEAARLLLALQDRMVRDWCMRWVDGAEGEAASSIWVELTRIVPPDVVAAPATLAAVVAYCRGDGARASIALDRALESDRDYRLARDIDAALRAGLPPTAVRMICQEAVKAIDAGARMLHAP